jgi:hypothetical protein
MWVELCDTDRDGKLSFTEFLAAALDALAGIEYSTRIGWLWAGVGHAIGSSRNFLQMKNEIEVCYT